MTTSKDRQPSASARRTPYEIVFTEGDFESRIFPRIRDEAAAEGVASLHRERFEFLSTAGEVIREVTPEDAPPDALEEYRSLLFHAFHHWSEGRRLFVVEPAAARYLVEAAPGLDEWSFRAPARSFYLQLPPNLFWSSISADAAPEPVDGFFVTLASGKDLRDATYEKLEVLAVLGIHRSRAGFSVIGVESELGDDILTPWQGEERAEGDFKNVLPGGEIGGLYSMLTTGEVLKLVARLCWYIDNFPDSLVEVVAAEPRDGKEEPPPTQLPHSRITLSQAVPEGSPGG